MTRDERVAKNCVVFRELNERIARAAGRAGFEGPTVFACECGDVECSEAIEVPLGRYEQVRSRPTVFLVATGHEMPGLEEVLDENENFLVVELVGAGVAIAERYDTRA